MLIPKKVKHRKHHRGHNKGKATSGNFIAFGSFALKAMEGSFVTARQIEAARRAMTRSVQRGGKIWIRIFPHIVVTRKPHDVKMGKGKGAPDHFIARVKDGTMLFEMQGVSEEIAREAMRLAAHKLPVKTKFIIKEQN